jgi:hypothetical protein
MVAPMRKWTPNRHAGVVVVVVAVWHASGAHVWLEARNGGIQ